MAMAAIASITSINTTHNHNHHTSLIFAPKQHQNKTRIHRFRCNGTNQKQESQPQNNAFLKVAWYSSELLGIAAAAFRSSPDEEEASPQRLLETIDRVSVVDTIKQDFERSYFVTGDLTLNAYEDDCEFADPAGSFKGLERFKRNCTNFGSLLEKSNMNLMKWEDFEDKGIGHWRFSCVLSFPWRPILSATGYTEYYFDAESGKVCRHVEHWNVPKMALFKQILRPSKGFGLKDYVTKWLKFVQDNPIATARPGLSLKRGLLFYQGRLVISSQSRCIPLLLKEFHSSQNGGHSRFLRTYRRIMSNLYWISMTKCVKEFV